MWMAEIYVVGVLVGLTALGGAATVSASLLCTLGQLLFSSPSRACWLLRDRLSAVLG
jgi:hypothetical protein